MPLESHHQPRDGIESHGTGREQDGDRESKKKNLRLGTEALQHKRQGVAQELQGTGKEEALQRHQ